MPNQNYVIDDMQRKKLGDCSLAMACKSCKQLTAEFGEKSIQSALDALGPTAAVSEIKALLIQGKPNPENS